MARPLKLTDVEVVVVTYNHKHGNDVGVFENGAAADEWIRAAIEESMDDVSDEIRQKLVRAFEDGDNGMAESLWAEEMNEHFDTNHTNVITLVKTGVEQMKESIDEKQESDDVQAHTQAGDDTEG